MRAFAWIVFFGGTLVLAACDSGGRGGDERTPWSFQSGMIFPPDRSLNRPEDGVALPGGRLIVADQLHGLRVVEPDGSSRPFGSLHDVGYEHRPPEAVGAANGVTLEPSGKHVLVADVFRGGIYRVDVESEATERVHQHEFGVNMARRDRKGGLWFSQSTRNRPDKGEEELWRSVDLQTADGALYHVPPAGSGERPPAIRLADGFEFANGIVLDEDRGRLYLAETMGNRVLRFRVDIDEGRVSERMTLLEVDHPDNLELDRYGRLWIACPMRSEIVVFNPETATLSSVFRISTPESERLLAQIQARLRERRPWLGLLTPELWEPGPGLMTGIILPRDGGPVHVTGLGDALIRLPAY